MKKVFLHGGLAEGINSSWSLNVNSPSEAIRAININSGGKFVRNINAISLSSSDIGIICMNEKESEDIRKVAEADEVSKDQLVEVISDPMYIHLGGSFDEIHFVPTVGGRFVFIPIFGMAAVAKAAFYMVASMLVAGIAAALFPPVKTTNRTRTTKSYVFGDRANIREQGGPVPVGYGMLRVGSVMASFVRRNKFLPGSIGDERIETYTSFSMQDIISEGPIGGLCDSQGKIAPSYEKTKGLEFDKNAALKSIYINDVKLMNDQGQLNFIPNEKTEGSGNGGEIQPVYTEGSQRTEGITHGIDYEKNAQSPLIGPDQGKILSHGFASDVANSGAGTFTYAITDRNVGMVTLNLSSEAMFHNWTDKRVRRRFIGRSVSVTTGTSSLEVQLAFRVFDGVKYTSPIMVDSEYSPLEDIEQQNGQPYTSRYTVQNLLTRSGHSRRAISVDEMHSESEAAAVGQSRLITSLVWFLFDDPEVIQLKDALPNGSTEQFAKKDIFLDLIGSDSRNSAAEDFISKLRSCLLSQDQVAYSGETATFLGFLEAYMSSNKRLKKNANGNAYSLIEEVNPDISIPAAALSSLAAEIESGNEGSDVRPIFLKNFHMIMSIIKSRVCGYDSRSADAGIVVESFVLGHDGHIYYRSGNVMWRRGKILGHSGPTGNDEDDADEEPGSYATYNIRNRSQLDSLNTNEAAFGKGVKTYVRIGYEPLAGLAQDFKFEWVVFDKPEYMPLAAWHRRNPDQDEADRPWELAASSSREQATIKIRGISTSPSSLDFNFQLPYVSEGESITLQVVRMSEEITAIKEQQEKQKRLSLKGIRQHVCLAGKKLRFNSICTSWAKVEFDSVNFQQIPERNYLVKLKKVAVPSNYDPVNRRCVGVWDGLFQGQLKDETFYDISEQDLEWTDNPAWILLDVLTNRRFGIGKSGLSIENIDVWNLYAVGKFCDELVETGFPSESPKRNFFTNNKNSAGDLPVKSFSASGLANDKRDIANAYDFIIELRDENDEPISKKYFQQEFARVMAGVNTQDESSSLGRAIAFYMEDGTIERRIVKKINAEDRQIILQGPSFIDHNSTNNSYETVGRCVLERSYAMVEPRFSMNTMFDKQEDAINVVRDITSSFRTVVNYLNGQVSFSPEEPQEPTMLFNDANVDKDGFSYAGSSKTSRVTVAKVRYVDRYDDFKSKVEYYEDPSGIEKFGYKEADIIAVGCSSRGQAQRLARFMVVAPLLETEVVSFKTGIEGAMLYPGAIVEVSDSRRFGRNVNGRVKNTFSGRLTVVLDKIISNIKFYDPVSQREDDRVELCVVASKGFEQIGGRKNLGFSSFEATGLYKKMSDLAMSADVFGEDDQAALIAGTKRSQMIYFDGYISSNRREINKLKRKYKFNVTENSNVIRSSYHNLNVNDEISFLTFGTLPTIKLKDAFNTVREISFDDVFVVTSGSQDSNHSFKVKLEDGTGIEFLDKGFVTADKGVSGGEHFYCRKGDDADTVGSINEIGIGAAWSIRGYRKEFMGEMVQRAQGLEDALNAIGAISIAGKTARYNHEYLGSFDVVAFRYDADDNGNASTSSYIDINQNGNSGKGLGLLRIVFSGWDQSEVASLSGLGVMRVVAHEITMDAGYSNHLHFFRPDPDSDILMLKGNFNGDAVTISGEQFPVFETKVTINDQNGVVTNDKLRKFIRLSTTSLAESALSEQDVATMVVQAISVWNKSATVNPETVTPVTINLTLSDAGNVNDYRNVGRRQYRISSISEENGVYDIKASEYNKEKFTIIEKKLSLNRPSLPIPPQADMSIPLPPSNIQIKDLTKR